MTWRELALNELPLSEGPMAVLIGETPSRGARSPILWNAAFARLGIPGRMVPVDINASGLPHLMAALTADPDVIGGAVTMPHKAAVIPHLVSRSAVAEAAGAVNCISRGDGGFVGENSDGIAALRSIERVHGSLDGARVLLLGTGGAGSAVAAAIAGALGACGSLTVANRSTAACDALVARLRASVSAEVRAARAWPIVDDAGLGTFDVIVNATSLGFQAAVPDGDGWLPARSLTPVTGSAGVPTMTREEAEVGISTILGDALVQTVAGTLAWLGDQQDALVFDIIYQPGRTLLLTLAELAGCRTMNGSWMNLEQAVIAFCKAVPAATGRSVDPDDVRAAMLAATEEAA